MLKECDECFDASGALIGRTSYNPYVLDTSSMDKIISYIANHLGSSYHPKYMHRVVINIAAELYQKDLHYNTKEKEETLRNIRKIINDEKENLLLTKKENGELLFSGYDFEDITLPKDKDKITETLETSMLSLSKRMEMERNNLVKTIMRELPVSESLIGIIGKISDDDKAEIQESLQSILGIMGNLVSYEMEIKYFIECKNTLLKSKLDRGPDGNENYEEKLNRVKQEIFEKTSPHNDFSLRVFGYSSSSDADIVNLDIIKYFLDDYDSFMKDTFHIKHYTDDMSEKEKNAIDKFNEVLLHSLPEYVSKRIKQIKDDIAEDVGSSLGLTTYIHEFRSNLRESFKKISPCDDNPIKPFEDIIHEHIMHYYDTKDIDKKYYDFEDGTSICYTNIACNQFDRIWNEK
jgi:hypothetical protein